LEVPAFWDKNGDAEPIATSPSPTERESHDDHDNHLSPQIDFSEEKRDSGEVRRDKHKPDSHHKLTRGDN
jgi:hypothetical protein